MAQKKFGRFIVVDGPDGAGKGVIVDFIGKLLKKNGRVFDVREYEKRTGRFPEHKNWKGAKGLLSAEPTHAYLGGVIRHELLSTRRTYRQDVIAESYSIDRSMHYTAVIEPALAKGIHVVQERFMSSSVIYGPLQDSRITWQWVAGLPGNRHAQDVAPDLMIIADAPPNAIMQRLKDRHHKRDNAIFETLPFLRRVQKEYHALWFRRFFARLGTRIVYIDMNRTIPEELKDVEKIVKPYL